VSNRDIIAIGTSAGGVEALLYIAKRLPRDFPACILVTIHLSRQARSSLDDILSQNGPLPAKFASRGEVVKKGHIYLAPPDHHLLLDTNHILLGEGPRENNARPAIDPMLRSVAVCCGPRAVGVVLTGTLGDGASGLWALGQCSGSTVVQDPQDAAFAEMPMTAVSRAGPHHIVTLADMPRLLESLAHQAIGMPVVVPRSIKYEVEIAKGGQYAMNEMDNIGQRSVLACPDCGGVMWEIDEGELVRYRCHVGHTYAAELMSVALDENLRRALASAQRALEERVALAHKLQRQAVASGHRLLAETWAQKAQEFERETKIIRESVQRMERLAA
jgi:two-component system, chemotaxis family, protein-glutamate methylesterase/glutaminase